MKEIILRIGIVATIIIITLLTVIASVLLAFVILKYAMHEDSLHLMKILPVAAIIPAVLVPIVGGYLVSLIIRTSLMEDEMKVLASYDALTGLLNRRVFLERAIHLYEIAKRERQDFTILAIDVDFFKLINDQYGHAIGDDVLSRLGTIVMEISRKSDISGRMGGEEFAFFLPNTSATEAGIFAERLHIKIRNTSISYKGVPVTFNISIGLASVADNDPPNLESLLHIADMALYEAKHNGRNQTSRSCKILTGESI